MSLILITFIIFTTSHVQSLLVHLKKLSFTFDYTSPKTNCSNNTLSKKTFMEFSSYNNFKELTGIFINTKVSTLAISTLVLPLIIISTFTFVLAKYNQKHL